MKQTLHTIELPCFRMKITVKGNSGTIESDLKGICPHCRNPQCNMSCDRFLEYKSDRDKEMQQAKEQEAIDFQRCRIAMDSIESIVLAHAVAGVDVEHYAYIEGIETACNAIINDI